MDDRLLKKQRSFLASILQPKLNRIPDANWDSFTEIGSLEDLDLYVSITPHPTPFQRLMSAYGIMESSSRSWPVC